MTTPARNAPNSAWMPITSVVSADESSTARTTATCSLLSAPVD